MARARLRLSSQCVRGALAPRTRERRNLPSSRQSPAEAGTGTRRMPAEHRSFVELGFLLCFSGPYCMMTHIKLQRYGSPARITESRARGVFRAAASLQAQPGSSDTERAWDQDDRSVTAVDGRCPPDPVQDACMMDPGPRNHSFPDGGCAGAISAARRSRPGPAAWGRAGRATCGCVPGGSVL